MSIKQGGTDNGGRRFTKTQATQITSSQEAFLFIYFNRLNFLFSHTYKVLPFLRYNGHCVFRSFGPLHPLGVFWFCVFRVLGNLSMRAVIRLSSFGATHVITLAQSYDNTLRSVQCITTRTTCSLPFTAQPNSFLLKLNIVIPDVEYFVIHC